MINPQMYFIDIETVPIVKTLNQLPESVESLFRSKNKAEVIKHRDEFGSSTAGEDVWDSMAGLQAEFGKIVCVSIGKVVDGKVFVKTILGTGEQAILLQLSASLERATSICAHNGKGFDFPFLFRRYLINNLPVPNILQVAGKKQWDLPFVDTMEMWSHVEWKYRCSLALLAHVLGLPSPKEDMDGSQVAEVYYSVFDVKNDELPFDKEKAALDKIGKYCAGDLVTLINVYCRLRGLEIFKPEQIEYVQA